MSTGEGEQMNLEWDLDSIYVGKGGGIMLKAECGLRHLA